MVDLDWHEVYEIGVDFIDEEHKQILSVMRSMSEAARADDHELCQDLSRELIARVSSHFESEEQYLKKHRFPGLHDHRKYHGELMAQAEMVQQACESLEGDTSLLECFKRMEKFFLDDILVGDLQFRAFLRSKGVLRKKKKSGQPGNLRL